MSPEEYEDLKEKWGLPENVIQFSVSYGYDDIPVVECTYYAPRHPKTEVHKWQCQGCFTTVEQTFKPETFCDLCVCTNWEKI